jgi:hypothetical protein
MKSFSPAEQWQRKIDKPITSGGLYAAIDRSAVRRMKEAAVDVLQKATKSMSFRSTALCMKSGRTRYLIELSAKEIADCEKGTPIGVLLISSGYLMVMRCSS